MTPGERPIEDILRDLKERTKELDCLYGIEELLLDSNAPLKVVFCDVARVVPLGWQYPAICRARIVLRNETYGPPDFRETAWKQEAPIVVRGERAGRIEVFYTEPAPQADEGPFLIDERRLIDTIGERLAHFLSHRELQQALAELQAARESATRGGSGDWVVVLEFLRRTDHRLFLRISRKMLNHLAWGGVEDAIGLLRGRMADPALNAGNSEDGNRPLEKLGANEVLGDTEEILRIARDNLGSDEILKCIQTWIREDKSSFLVHTVASEDSSLSEIRAAIGRYHQLGPDQIELPPAAQQGILVALIRRFFTDQVEFVNIAKHFIKIDDFFGLIENMVFPPASHGKLGGKSTGLFLAMAVLRAAGRGENLSSIRCPKTWYITSDGLLDFIRANSLEDVYNQKYVEIDQVRQEYPHIVHLFKNSRFSAEIMDGLSVALDNLEGRPIIVRSSSLLEDRMGAAFSGKYKSLFLANLGTKQERLLALCDAIAEVYASTFGPDPIEYRAERGLTDMYEEMGIMIQEVVGERVGPYFLPAFAGVAFSRNEFRWSHRIQRNDGLVRMVPGLGTRAVDRLKDDYPILLAPGQPGLRANVTPDEVVRYAPKKVDVISLETGGFETIEMAELLRAWGREYPSVSQVVSVFDGDRLRTPLGMGPDFENDDLVVTFEGLVQNTRFMATMKSVLEVLEEAFGTPVDIEFASNGRDIYLLQCRPQSHVGDSKPAAIPKDALAEHVLFTANRYISNGRVPGITHIVYIDPEGYQGLTDLDEMKAVGRAVGRLNNLLPKHQFILMGPGRWGSRGDIKLGVNVTYSDINNTSMLIEIARKKGSYVPDLSFGTHFFQDLVESQIRYLPLYPDDEGIVFRDDFLAGSPSILSEILPEFAFLERTVRVIDVPDVTGGLVLRVLMNAEQDAAMGILTPPQVTPGDLIEKTDHEELRPEHHWRWRMRFAERIAGSLDPGRFGVEAIYVLGSTKNASAGPASDIDLLIHFRGTDEQLLALNVWLEGWSLCLSEVNFLRTGCKSEGLLDVHIVRDEDIANRSSFAVKIGAITDPARLLPLRRRDEQGEAGS